MREIAKRTKLKLARARKASQNDSKSVLSSFFSFFCCPFAFEPIRAPFAAPLFRPFSKAMTAPRSPRRASAGGGLPVTVSPARESAPPHGGAAGGREKRRGLIVLALAAVGCLFLISLSSSSTSGLGGASLASPSGTTTRNSRRLLNTGEGEECAGIGVEGGAATCVLELDSRRNSFGPHPKISSSASFQKTARRDQSDFFGFSLSLSCSLSFLLPPFNEPASEPCPPRRSGVSDLRKACLVYENSLSFFEKAPTFFLSKSLKKKLALPPSSNRSPLSTSTSLSLLFDTTTTTTTAPSPLPSPPSFLPGQPWFDSDGNAIQAHGGSALRTPDGTYWWYGEDKSGASYETAPGGHWRVDTVGVAAYWSRDLVSWHRSPRLALAATKEIPDLNPKTSILERPKVVYNAKTKK